MAHRADPGGVRPAPPPHLTRPGGPDALLAWRDAGPVAARERWDSYRHEGGLSVTWALREAPRQAVGAGVLAPLLAPGPFPRRTTWLYQPYPAEQAAAKVENEVTSGQVRRAWAEKTRRDETQRERDDRDRAQQSAREEAQGAGVGRFTVYVTTTVLHDDDLPAAIAHVEQRAGQSKLAEAFDALAAVEDRDPLAVADEWFHDRPPPQVVVLHTDPEPADPEPADPEEADPPS